MAFKQLVPEHTVTIAKGVVQIRVKHFPAIFLIANTISGVAIGTETAMLLAWLGFLTSWTYLRFYRVSPLLSTTNTGEGTTIRGDASDTFAFAYFFPDAVHAPVAALSDVVYGLLVTFKICSPFSAEDVDASNEQASARGQGTLPNVLDSGRSGRSGGRREEAERRRALALRALEQRIQAVPAISAQVALADPSQLPEARLESGIES